jgi:hypothetical protein
MKPSHLTTPRQLADCTFTAGHTEALNATAHSAHWAVVALVSFACGLLVAGVI